jgi:hypothetical protein
MRKSTAIRDSYLALRMTANRRPVWVSELPLLAGCSLSRNAEHPHNGRSMGMFAPSFSEILFIFFVLVAVPHSGTASAKKCRRSEKIAEVVPAARVRKCIYSNVGKNASDQAKKIVNRCSTPDHNPGGSSVVRCGCVAQAVRTVAINTRTLVSRKYRNRLFMEIASLTNWNCGFGASTGRATQVRLNSANNSSVSFPSIMERSVYPTSPSSKASMAKRIDSRASCSGTACAGAIGLPVMCDT